MREDLDGDEGKRLRSLMPPMSPRARFAQSLGDEIRRAAYERLEEPRTVPFEDVIVELRKLIRLLCKTLVPVQPRAEFVQELEEQLRMEAAELALIRQERWWWIIAGSLLGSLISLVGVIAALLLRRRNGRPQVKKPLRA
jgi:hypothetical protein